MLSSHKEWILSALEWLCLLVISPNIQQEIYLSSTVTADVGVAHCHCHKYLAALWDTWKPAHVHRLCSSKSIKGLRDARTLAHTPACWLISSPFSAGYFFPFSFFTFSWSLDSYSAAEVKDRWRQRAALQRARVTGVPLRWKEWLTARLKVTPECSQSIRDQQSRMLATSLFLCWQGSGVLRSWAVISSCLSCTLHDDSMDWDARWWERVLLTNPSWEAH